MRRLLASLLLAIALVGTAAGQSLFVNEFHYDNDGGDTGERVELAGPAGTDLAGWRLVFYNGANGASYDTIDLSGVLPDQAGGYGTTVVEKSGIQNGAPDGFALVDPSGTVVQFLSYEGDFTAAGGPADGMASTDVGVAEDGSTPVGFSLQLAGTGAEYADFTWSEAAAETFGAPNTGQTFSGSGSGGGPGGPGGTCDAVAGVFLNELHYDNDGSDTGEALEVAGPAGTDLAGWSVALYNGNGGAVYGTVALSGTLPDEGSGYGTLAFAESGIQNGSPDGLALVDCAGTVVQFLSYEGDFTAAGGPADGMLSEDIGVTEGASTPVGYALGLVGTGTAYADFTWEAPSPASFGTVNPDQSFGGAAGGVFFSEYVEGSSLNKAVEIYNATGAPVDLAAGGYAVEFYFNGSTTPGATIPLTGTLAAGDVYVVADDGADAAILAAADLAPTNNFFNGDDAVALRDAAGLLDVIGRIGADPGSEWGSGLTSTADNTLRRLAATCSGDPDGSDAFDPAAGWDGFAGNTFDGLGAHTATCGGAAPNAPPAFVAALGDRDVPAGRVFTFDYDATDDDGDALSYTLPTGPAGASIDPVTGVFTWTPDASLVGTTQTVSVAVTDGRATTETTATLTVGSANAAPVFTAALADAFVPAGTPVGFDYDATDAESDPITYTLVDAPAGATLDASTGAFAWTPSAPGVYAVTVAAEDATGSTTTTAVVGAQGTLFPGETGGTLRASVRAAYAPDATLGYDTARDTMYLRIERAPDGTVTGVYTGFSVVLPDGVDPSAYLASNGINAEHTWPQSKGAGDEPARSDLHNLFPSKDNVNSARSNKPFDEIPDAVTDTWYRGTQSLTTIPTEDLPAWSESATAFFEPREVHKGDAARASLYFYTIYESRSDESFLLAQKETLVDWNTLDPASLSELVRTYRISTYQGNVNPLLIDPTLAGRLVDDVTPPPPPAVQTVADARAEADGALVTVEGIVTRAEGRFARLQDETAGITVFESGGAFRQAVDGGAIRSGDRLRLTGTLTEFNGLREIEPAGDAFEVLARDQPLPTPQRVTLAELDADGEAYESELVVVYDLTVDGGGDAAFDDNTSYTVTDPTGTGVLRTPREEDTRIEGEPVPTGTAYFLGVVGQFGSTYQLQPVAATDVRPVGAAVACERAAPNLVPRGFAATGGEYADFENIGGAAIDLASCAWVSWNAFTGRALGAVDLAGVLAPGDVLRVGEAGVADVDVVTGEDPLPDGPGAYSVHGIEASDVPRGTSVTAPGVFATVVASVVYLQDGTVFGQAPAAGTAKSAVDLVAGLSAVAEAATPEAFALEGNYPNPFNPQTTIRFALPEPVHVRVTVYDLMGREVARVADAPFAAGRHAVVFDAAGLPSGTYLYRVEAGEQRGTGRMVLVK